MRILIVFLFSTVMAAGISSCTKNNVPLPAAGSNSAADVVKPDRDETPSIRGHIKNTGGGAIASASAELFVSGQSTPAYSATTASDGSYAMTNIVKGSYTLKLSASGYVTKNIGITLNADTVREDTLVTQ